METDTDYSVENGLLKVTKKERKETTFSREDIERNKLMAEEQKAIAEKEIANTTLLLTKCDELNI